LIAKGNKRKSKLILRVCDLLTSGICCDPSLTLRLRALAEKKWDGARRANPEDNVEPQVRHLFKLPKPEPLYFRLCMKAALHSLGWQHLTVLS